ncbi:MAG: hypothetical protein HQK60_19690, partial [Deltaproteobacteria bacterium]|nr:hypothetical protein [Deltaproteobacteria bacterium]
IEPLRKLAGNLGRWVANNRGLIVSPSYHIKRIAESKKWTSAGENEGHTEAGNHSLHPDSVPLVAGRQDGQVDGQ